MANASMHIIVPMLMLFIFYDDIRSTLMLLPASLFPDLDYFLVHRGTLHNIFIPLCLLMLYLKSRSQKITIALVYLSSHLFLDIFNMGIIPFYPFSIRNVMINAELGLEIVKDPVTEKIIATNVVSTVAPSTMDYILPLKSYVQFSNSVEFGVFMLGISVLIYKLYNKKMRG
ncbi:hypothetical protein ACFLY8_02720 [Halobacteriota archaeon]